MRPNQRRRVSWSELPTELLLIIAKHLVIRNDVINFRRVCKSWRHSAPLSLLNSKHILSPIFPHTLTITPCYYSQQRRSKVLVANSIFLLKPAFNRKTLKPWLLSVEESNSGILSVRSPLSRILTSDLPEEFTYELNLSNFDVLELGNFHIYKYSDDDPVSVDDVNDMAVWRYHHGRRYFPLGNKVVLFPNPDCDISGLTIDECSVVELTNHVPIVVRRLSDGVGKDVYFRGRKLDDILNYKGKIYGIDRKARVCSLDYHTLKMTSVSEEPLCEGTGSDNRKRLAVSGDELYLVYTWWRKQSQLFKVFRLNEEEEKWDKLDGIGNDRILFVTFDGCFFASTKDFPPPWRGNCIVSVKGSFPAYTGHGISYAESQCFEVESDCISVFHFEGGDCGPLDSYPGYSDVLWPPPSWLWMNPCEIEEEDDDEDEEDKDEDEKLEDEDEDEEVEEGEGGETEEGNEEPSGEEGNEQGGEEEQQEITENHVHAAKGTQNVQEDIPHEEFKDKNNVDSAFAMNSPLKVAENEGSRSKFLGVDVSSHSIPILQKIWDKHGNIMEGHVVNSDSLLTWALESLAKTIIILQSNSGRSLDESQAKFLKSILLDFRLMHFNIVWLVPFVEKALALHKNKVIMELEMAKSKLQAELREVEERLAAQGKRVPDSQLVSLDLKDVLN